MLVDVTLADITALSSTWQIVVPGDRTWKLRSVHATVLTQIGGQPNRLFRLDIGDGTNTVATIGAQDAGTEPATVELTWTDVPAGAVTVANLGISAAPLPNLVLQGGYIIQGTIVNGVAGDSWESALAWYDYSTTGG